jgi:hypothetical protein
MAIDTVHLIHHTHHDYGYTDVPAAALRGWNDFHDQALDLIAASAGHPEEARFRWTCEGFDPTWRWWQQAPPARRAAFRAAVAAGRLEVGALPWNGHALSTRDGLDQAWDRAGELWTGMRTSFAMQVDVNGLSWGAVPWLLDRGVDLVWLAANPYSGRNLEPVPALRRWQGADGREILLMLATPYIGDWFFTAQAFRQLPLSRYDDPWVRPPDGTEILRCDPAGIRQAANQWQRHQPAWPWPVVALPITHQWRMDNDPPFSGMSDFVRAWNQAGVGPRLIISTPQAFLRDLLARVPRDRIPACQGDLSDWWADAAMAMPDLIQTARRTQQQMRVLSLSAPLLGADPAAGRNHRDAALDAAALAEEHTMGAYESLPEPHTPRALGNLAFRLDLLAQADDRALAATRAVIESSPQAGRFQRAQVIGVVNPNPHPAGGFIAFPANALRSPAASLEDMASGERHALELLPGPDMGIPPSDNPPDGPWLVDDESGFRPVTARALIPTLAAGELRRYRLVAESTPVRGARDDLELAPDGGIRQLHRRIAGRRIALVGAAGVDGAGFAEPLIEAPTGRRIRHRLCERSPAHSTGLLAPQRATLHHHRVEDHAGFLSLVRSWRHPTLQRIDQRLDLPHGVTWAEITTSIVVHETFAPLGLHLALPLAGDGASLRYHSLGYPTRPGHDQHPGASGEFVACDPGLTWEPATGIGAWLDLRDTPLVALDRLATRTGRAPFAPTGCRCYAVLHQSWWNTNFPPTRSAVWTWTTRISLFPGLAPKTPDLPLFAYPAHR